MVVRLGKSGAAISSARQHPILCPLRLAQRREGHYRESQGVAGAAGTKVEDEISAVVSVTASTRWRRDVGAGGGARKGTAGGPAVAGADLAPSRSQAP